MSASCLRQMILSALPTTLSLLFLSPRPIYNRHLIVYTEFLKRDLMQTLTNISSCPSTPKARKKKNTAQLNGRIFRSTGNILVTLF